jgi:hypothetical protein
VWGAAERSAAPSVRGTRRSATLAFAAALALAAEIVAGCRQAGADHPVATPSSTALTVPPAESQTDAVRALSKEGPVQVVRGTHSIVISNTGSGTDAHDLANRVDAAVPAAAGFWRTSWPRPVVVLVPASLAHWQELTGLPPDPQVAAVTLGASSTETSRTGGGAASGSASTTPGRDARANASPGSIAGGQRIVVDPVAYRRLSDAGRSVVLRHEVEHLVSASHTPPGMPSWLVEGTADVVGFTGSAIPVPQAAEELAAVVRRSGPPASLPSNADYLGGSSSVAYEEGWLACRLIDRDKGAAALRSFYDGVAGGIRARGGTPSAGELNATLGNAMHQATGWSVSDFVNRWRADLVHELGSTA